jgi:hypothetical protein
MEKSCQNNEKNYTDLDIYSKHQCYQIFFSGDSDTKYTGQFNCYFIFSLPKKVIEKKFDDNEKKGTHLETYPKCQCYLTFLVTVVQNKLDSLIKLLLYFLIQRKKWKKDFNDNDKMAQIWKLIPKVNVVALFSLAAVRQDKLGCLLYFLISFCFLQRKTRENVF